MIVTLKIWLFTFLCVRREKMKNYILFPCTTYYVTIGNYISSSIWLKDCCLQAANLTLMDIENIHLGNIEMHNTRCFDTIYLLAFTKVTDIHS